MARTRTVASWIGMALIVSACGGGGGGGGDATGGSAQVANSFICPGLTGGEALAWDIYNGVLRTDPVLPPAVPAGPSYGHPRAPLLGFSYPPGYTPFTTDFGIQEFGVDLVRDDNLVVWREYYRNVFGNVSAAAIRDGETQGVLNHIGQSGAQPQVICTQQGTFADPFGTDFIISVANQMFRVGNFTAIVIVRANFSPSLGTTNSFRKVYLAPTAEFGARAIDTFLAIDWQMSFGDVSGFQDTDGDGWRDSADIDPLDPNEPTPGGLPGF